MTDQFKRTMNLIDACLEKICAINCELYKQKLELMEDEELHTEFCDKIGDVLGEYKTISFHKGREGIVEYLCDKFGVVQYEKYIA